MPHLTIADVASRKPAMAEKKKGWIKKGASKHPGLFAKKAERAGMTTREFARKEKHAGGTLGKEANFAINAMGAAKKSPLYTHPRSRKD